MRLVSDCHLVDPILHKHGFQTFTTYQRGSRVLNYILVDPDLLPIITTAGYEPFYNRIISNHWGMYIDLDTQQCFGSTLQPLVPIQLRDLSTKRSHQIAPYFKHKHKHLSDHQWFLKVSQLQRDIDNGQPNHQLAEELYI